MVSGRRAKRTSRRRGVGSAIVGVIGELFLTAAVFIFLFLGWQLWLNDLIVGGEQQSEAQQFSRELGGVEPQSPAEPDEDFGEPVVSAVADETTKFANLYVPRFGADYVRTIAEGVGEADVLTDGVGHYPDTQMPGEIGNFGIAAHRTTHGAPFRQIADLQVGDRMYVQTEDGWYTYVYRSSEYVLPTGVGVLEPVPQSPDVDPTERLITLTSCNPMFSAQERIIAYGVFESWQPASAGAPEAIASIVGEGA